MGLVIDFLSSAMKNSGDPIIRDTERELADALSEGIVLLDADSEIIWWNKAATHLLGLRTQHHGSPIRRVLKGTGLRLLFDNPEEPANIMRKDGRKTLHLNVSLSVFREKYRLLTIRDITRRQRLESMRKDFVGNVSHELRTPLTVFRGYLELLLEQPDAVAGQEEVILQQMNDQCQRMESLVNGVLLLSRLEDDDPDPATHQAVLVDALIRDIVHDAQHLSAGRHEFILHIDSGLYLYGQSVEIRSLFSNIIYNAVHYTPEGGAITINWQEIAGRSVFSVEDTGIGIALKHIEKLTRRFYRVDKARQRRAGGGTGLGLAIAKHVLLRHDGRLEIESVLNKGSKFSCIFPQVLRTLENSGEQ